VADAPIGQQRRLARVCVGQVGDRPEQASVRGPDTSEITFELRRIHEASD